MHRFLHGLRGSLRAGRRAALRLEQLEDRSLPSGLTAPAFSSDPGAPASIWLDFTGLPTQNWGAYHNVATPAFDLDNPSVSPSSFSAQEIAVMTEVWQRVAEIYSPFDLNVTTVQPADLSHGKTMIVAVGGSYKDWYGQAAGGITYTGSFINPAEPNVSHVFVDGTDGVAEYIAIAVAHETGHGFGLDHQSIVNGSGVLVNEYNSGDSAEAPIMGLAYNAQRALWWVGTADTGAIQDDEAVIAGPANGFGYRPDPYGQGLATATPLSVFNGGVAASGVIDTPSSADYFTFATSGGPATFTVGTAAVGATLHARLELYSSAGVLVAVGDSPTTLGASVSAALAAGQYYVVVRSHGDHGDVGQYSLYVNAPQATVAAPSNPAFLVRLYEDLLNRNPAPAETAGWTAALNAGVTPAQVVHAFMTSPEYLNDVVSAAYLKYLGRPPDAGGLSGWTAALEAGMTQEQLADALLSSQEFYRDHGGNFSGWLSGVYQAVLGRPADPGAVAGWSAGQAGGMSLGQVALAILTSTEADTDYVESAYHFYLQRPADPGGLGAWAAALQNGTTWEEVVAGLCSSSEFVQL